MASTEDFSQWLDAALARKIPTGVVAYCFNIYETTTGYEVELVGAGKFDPDDEDWACDEVFTTRRNLFPLTRRKAGADWKKALAYVTSLVQGYLTKDSVGTSKLQSGKAVAVGFVDGNLEFVWRARRRARA